MTTTGGMARSVIHGVEQAGGRTIEPDLVFDAERDAPALVETVAGVCPDIGALMGELRTALPLPLDAAVRQRGQLYRLPGHNRSFCWGLPTGQESLYQSEALIFKGTEPLLEDFPAYLDWMMAAPFRDSGLSVGVYFPVALRMPPGAMPLDECLREQRIATEVHRRHLDTYGQLLQSPVPLFVHRVAADAAAAYTRVVERRLPPPAFERVEARIRGGLGVCVFYYPTSPIRVDDLGPLFGPGLAMDVQMAEGTIEAWVQAFARLLHLRYMPYTPWNNGWGACLDVGNACIDGGVADLLTLTPFEAIDDARIFRMSVLSSLDILGHTVATLCRALEKEGGQGADSSMVQMATSFVRARLVKRLAEETAAGRPVDARVHAALEPERLQALLDAGGRRGASAPGPYYSGPDRVDDMAVARARRSAHA